MYTIILFLFFYLCDTAKRIHGNTLCSSNYACPADKPFCTDAGCVFECPTPLYTNGSTCVPSCGDWFITNNSCGSSCPLNWKYRETPRVIGSNTYIDNICTPACDQNEFLIESASMCVRACPLQFAFVDGITCVESCPENKHFLLSFTIKSVNYFKCLDTCPHLVDGGYCTDECNPGLFAFNLTCVHSCPDSHPLKSGKTCTDTCSDEFIFNENNTCQSNCSVEKPIFFPNNKTCGAVCPEEMYLTVRRGISFCEHKCQQTEIIYQRSCVSSCSDPIARGKKLYLLNDTCVERCPYGFLMRDDGKEHRYCVDVCGQDEFMFNNSCIDLCPENTFVLNSTCVDECPQNMHFVCQVQKGRRCGEICPPYTNEETHYVCIDECPNYRDGDTCTQKCPVSKYTHDNVCASECPHNKPIVQTGEISFKICTAYNYYWYRETEQLELRKICVSKCRDGLVIFNSTCQSSCPEKYPYLVKGTCQAEKCNKLMYVSSNYINCTDECQTEDFLNNDFCVNQCPSGTFITNRICHTSKCQTKYEYKKGNVTICTDDCAGYGFVSNSMCTDTCPHVVFDNKCVMFCPETHPIEYNQTISSKDLSFTECVNFCPENLFLFNGTCVDHCPESKLLFNKSCVNICPESHRLKQVLEDEDMTLSCVENCTEPYPFLNRNNLTCVNMCPPLIKYIHLNVCEEYCPAGNIQYHTSSGIVCSSTCPKDMLQFNLTCVEKCPETLYNYRGSACVYNCSGDRPFGLQEESWKCISACDTHKFFKDGQCLPDYDCKDPYFLYQNQCIKNCPTYYLWNNGCHSIFKELLPPCLSFLAALLFVVCYSRRLLKEYFSVLRILAFGMDQCCQNRQIKDVDAKFKEEDQLLDD